MYKITGIEHLNYKSKRTGEVVDAYNFFLTDLELSDRIIGVKVETFFISGRFINDILRLNNTNTVADLIDLEVLDISFNRYGNCTGFLFN